LKEVCSIKPQLKSQIQNTYEKKKKERERERDVPKNPREERSERRGARMLRFKKGKRN